LLTCRRSFSYAELHQAAVRAGWRHFGHARFLPGSQAVWMSIREAAPLLDCALPEPNLAAPTLFSA
jgi:hypothetical protein